MPEKRCGLITILAPAVQNEWAANIDTLLRRFRPAALILPDGEARAAGMILRAANALEVAILVMGPGGEGGPSGAHGVYFESAGDVAKARAALGSGAIIGAGCELSRHAAMENAEQGADFIAFQAAGAGSIERAAGLCAWWDGISGVPVALECGLTRPSRDVLAKAQADFLILEEAESFGESLTFATEFGLQSAV